MIKIICVGSIKEDYFRNAIEEYKKRLSKYTKLVLKHIDSKDYVITLEIEEKELSSEEFAEKIESIQTINPNIVFVIGGSYGISSTVKERSNYKLSFSEVSPFLFFSSLLIFCLGSESVSFFVF